MTRRTFRSGNSKIRSDHACAAARIAFSRLTRRQPPRNLFIGYTNARSYMRKTARSCRDAHAWARAQYTTIHYYP